MSAQLSAHGRLVTDVQVRTTRQETKMAFTRMAVSLPRHSVDAGQETFWLSVVAFGSIAESLSGHKKADMQSVSGSMQMTHWKDRDGTQHTGYQIVADAVISVRPGGGTRTARHKNNEPVIPEGAKQVSMWRVRRTTGKFTGRWQTGMPLTSAPLLMIQSN